jgi:hypothetical protein
MRACATANAVVIGLVLSSVGFAACSSSSPPQPVAGPDAPPPSGSAADMPSEVAPPPDMSAKKAPTTMAECKDIIGNGSAPNDPPNGTVMNNAMTAGDAGSSDRMQGLVDIVKGRRDGFRCCYDLWSKKNPGQEGKIVMVWSLKAKGELDKVTVDATKSTLKAPDVEACMINIASSLAYPPSPSAKVTTFSYPFEFRAHNATK